MLVQRLCADAVLQWYSGSVLTCCMLVPGDCYELAPLRNNRHRPRHPCQYYSPYRPTNDARALGIKAFSARSVPGMCLRVLDMLRNAFLFDGSLAVRVRDCLVKLECGAAGFLVQVVLGSAVPCL
eukprot:3749961-Rhodomonas_salina.1